MSDRPRFLRTITVPVPSPVPGACIVKSGEPPPRIKDRTIDVEVWSDDTYRYRVPLDPDGAVRMIAGWLWREAQDRSVLWLATGVSPDLWKGE